MTTWNEATPVGTDYISGGDDAIRDLRLPFVSVSPENTICLVLEIAQMTVSIGWLAVSQLIAQQQ